MTAPTRRIALAGIAGAAFALPATASARTLADTDGELIALSEEILRRHAEAEQFRTTRVDGLHEQFLDVLLDDSQPAADRSRAAWAFSEESGHRAATIALTDLFAATDNLFKRLMAIPAATQAGRAAKVRTLITYVMRSDWCGPAAELDWDKEMARALLGEFAGMSAKELAAIKGV